MTWCEGEWQIQYADPRFGWVTGRASIRGTTATITYQHPTLGTLSPRVVSVDVEDERLSIQLAPIEVRAEDWPRVPPGQRRIAARDPATATIRVGTPMLPIAIAPAPAPGTRMTLRFDGDLQLAEGLWTQPLVGTETSPHPSSRRGELDQIGRLAVGREVWTRKSPLIRAVVVAPPAEPGAHADPSTWPAAERRRTLFVIGRELPDQPTIAADAPFTASAVRRVTGEEARRTVAAAQAADDPSLQVWAVDVEWTGDVTAGRYELRIAGLTASWPLAWIPWNVGIGFVRDEDVAGDPHWVAAERVWSGDRIAVRLLPTTGMPVRRAVAIVVRSLAGDGSVLAERALEVAPAEPPQSVTLTLGVDVPVDATGSLETTFAAGSELPRARVDVHPIPDESVFERLVKRVAGLWHVPADPTHVVASYGSGVREVDVMVRDHAALLHVQDVFSRMLAGHIQRATELDRSAWATQLAGVVAWQTITVPGAPPTTKRVRAPLADINVIGPTGAEVPIALLAEPAADVARQLGCPESRVTGWRPWALEEARRLFIDQLRQARRKVTAVSDTDLDGLCSIAAVAGAGPANAAAATLYRFDPELRRMIPDLVARGCCASVGTLAAHADAVAEYNEAWLAIAGAAVAVLTGGIAYFVAAPAIVAGAIVAGTIVDLALLVPEMQKWSDEDWRVAVSSGGYIVVGADMYQRMAAAQTSTGMRVLAVAGAVLGPLFDGVDVMRKVAQASRGVAIDVATRVLAAGSDKVDDTLAALTAAEKTALVRYLDDAVAKLRSGVPWDKLDDLEKRALDSIDMLRRVDPAAAMKPAIEGVIGAAQLADGHTLNAVSTGACAICSWCSPLGDLFEGVLKEHPQLAAELTEIENALRALPKLPPPGQTQRYAAALAKREELLARSQRLHEKLRELASTAGGTLADAKLALANAPNGAEMLKRFARVELTDRKLAAAIAGLVGCGNHKVAATVINALTSAATDAGPRTLLGELASNEAARAGLVRLLSSGDELQLIGAYLLHYRKGAQTWKIGDLHNIRLLEMVTEMSQSELDGLKILFSAGGQNVLMRRNARSFTAALIDSLDEIDSPAAIHAFKQMLGAVDDIASKGADGIARLTGALAGRSPNAFFGGLYQLWVAGLSLAKFGDDVELVLEVMDGASRRIDIVIKRGDKILIEIETKAHNAFTTLEKASTLGQFVRDLRRITLRGDTSFETLQWSITKLMPKADRALLEGFFACAFNRTQLRRALKRYGASKRYCDAIIQLLDEIEKQVPLQTLKQAYTENFDRIFVFN